MSEAVASKLERKKRLIKLLSIPVLLFVVYAIAAMWQALSLNADLAALESMGVPTTLEKIRAMAPTEGENAAPLYKAATQKLLTAPDRDQKLRDDLRRGGNASSAKDTWKKANGAARNLQHLMEPFREAAKLPRVVFPRFGVSQQDEFDLYEKRAAIREGARFLQQNAICLSRTGEPLKAFDDIDSTRKMFAQVDGLPTSMDYLISRGIENHAIAAFQSVLKEHMNNEQVVDRAIEFALSIPPQRPLKSVLALDFAFDFDSLSRPREPDPEFKEQATFKQRLMETRPVRRYIRSRMVKAWKKAYEKMPSDPNDWQGVATAFETADKEIGLDSLLESASYGGFFSTARLSAGLWVEQLAKRRMALVAAHIAKWKLEQGSLPASLSVLNVDIIDPCSRKELKYRQEGKGFILYSVGRDLKDDGGRLRAGNPTWDVIFDLR